MFSFAQTIVKAHRTDPFSSIQPEPEPVTNRFDDKSRKMLKAAGFDLTDEWSGFSTHEFCWKVVQIGYSEYHLGISLEDDGSFEACIAEGEHIDEKWSVRRKSCKAALRALHKKLDKLSTSIISQLCKTLSDLE